MSVKGVPTGRASTVPHLPIAVWNHCRSRRSNEVQQRPPPRTILGSIRRRTANAMTKRTAALVLVGCACVRLSSVSHLHAWIISPTPLRVTSSGDATSNRERYRSRLHPDLSTTQHHLWVSSFGHGETLLHRPPPSASSSPWCLCAKMNPNNDENDVESSPRDESTSANPNQTKKPQQQTQSKLQQSSRKNKKATNATKSTLAKQLSKQDLVQAVGQEMKAKRQQQKRVSNGSSTGSSGGGGMNTESIAGGSSSSSSGIDAADSPPALLDRINPFKAGQNLRRTIDTAITSIQTTATVDAVRQSKYYLDDRFLDAYATTTTAREAPNDQDDFVPEVLVVGATGAVGQLVVRQLLAGNSRVSGNRVRVRVLVRDLYTSTLNLFGTAVTYCPGDLSNPDSLEYACTDVDKIIFCASTPRPDEDQFRTKFHNFVLENSVASTSSLSNRDDTSSLRDGINNTKDDDADWARLDSILAVRAALAEQVDVVGMQNLVRAYQHVRHSDYGTSQAAKRSLFKFQDRPEDFNLFDIDQNDEYSNESDRLENRDRNNDNRAKEVTGSSAGDYYDNDDDDDQFSDSTYDEEYTDLYGSPEDDEYANYDATEIETRSNANAVKTQSRWIQNQFEHGVFVGRIPQTAVSSSTSAGAEAAIVSSRLRSRDDPENGIELGPGFAGFVCRICSDGSTYEAFVRTGAYNTHGIEYVCEFSTRTKTSPSSLTSSSGGKSSNKSSNKFTTLRLSFENFKPVQQRTNAVSSDSNLEEMSIPPFRGRDVRHIGFRYRSTSNAKQTKLDKKGVAWNRFYLALSYIKVYRSQPEPEFVYLSDARIPPVVRDCMIRHDSRQLVGTATESTGQIISYEGIKLLDDSLLDGKSSRSNYFSALNRSRSPEETYFQYRGEEILKNSGLSYSIVRVSDFNESPSSSEETIALSSSWSRVDEMEPVSRADVAKVCVSALLDPHALNKSFYVSKKVVSGGSTAELDQDMSSKFAVLSIDQIA